MSDRRPAVSLATARCECRLGDCTPSGSTGQVRDGDGARLDAGIGVPTVVPSSASGARPATFAELLADVD